jgi:hypothetical protein
LADVNISGSPYYDRFNSTSNRTKVLFRPDRPLQQSELIEMQSIAENNIKRLGDSIFKDGAIQTGMAFSINNTTKKITVADGLVYVAGRIRAYKSQSITFNGTGTEKIGVKVTQSVVDSTQDSSLLDPTQNVPSYNSAGADRLVETVVLTYNDDTAPVIYVFNDGQLFIDPNRPEFSQINTVLAQRTFEESGSYQVDGFKMWIEPSAVTGKVDLVVDKGIAYVLGYRVSKPTSTRIQVDKSATFNHITQETSTYTTAAGKVKVNSSWVKGVTSVVGRTVSPTGGVTISKGATDGRDALPGQYTNVDATTVQVWVTSPSSKYYVRGTDYNVTIDSGITYINWNASINGVEPTTGVSYFVSFEYDRVMTLNTDYKITTTPHTADPGSDTYVQFSTMAGVKPKDGGTVRVDYDYYLGRMDLVTLDSNGNFNVMAGQPNRDGTCTPPGGVDPLSLVIGVAYLYPNASTGYANNTAVSTLTMADLQKLKSRLENVEYNQSVMLLELQATQSQDPLTLRGVFVEAFTDFSKIDDVASTTVAFSFDDATLTLSSDTPDSQKYKPVINLGQTTGGVWGRLVTAPYTEVKEISQPLATSAWQVNPYQVYNKQGAIKLTPASDNWVEESTVTVYNEDHVTTRLNKWWRHTKEGDPNGKLSETNQHLVDNSTLLGGLTWTDPSLFYGDKTVQGLMWSTSSKTVDNAILYMRQIDVNFSVSNLQPNANNLVLTFDGITVAITPTNGSLAGSNSGTIRSDASGNCSGKFKIPAGVRCGTREITLSNSTNMAIGTFTAQGIEKDTTVTVTKTYVTFNLYDPLAESFAFTEARTVTSVGVYFASKDATSNIIMQIRGLSEGGFPNRTVYAERVLKPSDITVSADASIETKIKLDDPLMVQPGEMFCMVFITDSPNYTMWTATMGEKLINDQSTTVTAQPYVNGVLFDSSNAVSWTVHQKSDLKFNVYTANFNDTGVIVFDPMYSVNSDGVLLLASYLTPANTGCTWEIKILDQTQVATTSIDSVPWQPLSNYTAYDTPFIVGVAQLRATFTSSKYISPMLVTDDLLLVNFLSATTGDYVTKTIDSTGAPFNFINLSFDADIPGGCTVVPKYSTDGGTTWNSFTAAPTTAAQSSVFTRYTYTQTLAQNYTSIKYKVTLTASNRFLRPRIRKLTALTHNQ